jgi:hypothetical protein
LGIQKSGRNWIDKKIILIEVLDIFGKHPFPNDSTYPWKIMKERDKRSQKKQQRIFLEVIAYYFFLMKES